MYSHKKRHFTLFFILCTLCLVVLAGCGNKTQENDLGQNQSNNATMPDSNNQNENNRSIDNATNDDNMTNNSTSENNNIETNHDNLSTEAKAIADDIVQKITEVNDAHVLLTETTAYIALDIERTADTAEAAQLKEQVSELVKEKQTHITNVYVTEDADTFTRFGEIATDIANGKPISGFIEEIENFFTRVTPNA